MFDLTLFLADSRHTVPVNLRLSNRTIRQGHSGEAFSLSPPAFPVGFRQSGKLANRLSNRKYFHTRKLTEDFKIHYPVILTNNIYPLQ